MASYTIPFLVSSTEPKPGKHFSLDVSDARNNRDLIDDFTLKTWTCCTDPNAYYPVVHRPGMPDRHTWTRRQRLSFFLAGGLTASRRLQSFVGPVPPRMNAGTDMRIRDVIFSRGTKSRSDLKRFDCFGSLPFELKDQIWESCLEPQTHTVICLVEADDTTATTQILSKMWLLETSVKRSARPALSVPLFHICRQSRAVALRFYRRLDPGVYFSPMLDTLRLSLLSTTVFTRYELEGYPGAISYKRTEGMSTPGFDGFDILSEMGLSSNPNAKSHCFFRPHYYQWPNGRGFYDDEDPPHYVLSRIPLNILQQVQNLEVLCFYEPNLRTPCVSGMRLEMYFTMDNCPILDLAGLRTLTLKVWHVGRQMKPPTRSTVGLDWRELVDTIVDLAPEERGLHQLRSLEVIKVCSPFTPRLLEDYHPLGKNLVSRLKTLKSRVLTKLSKEEGNWRP